MMHSMSFVAAMLAVTAPVAIYAQATPKFSTASSKINDLLADPQAKAVLEKHLPQVIGAADRFGDQTLKALQGMAPDRMPDKLLAEIDADLAKIK
jgi:para-nitrobenzyl esterase